MTLIKAESNKITQTVDVIIYQKTSTGYQVVNNKHINTQFKY